MTTLNYITNSLEDFCNKHKEIMEFGKGSYYKIDTNYKRKYPLVWITPQPSYIGGTVQDIKIHIMIGDNMYEDESNKWDCWNKSLSIATDISDFFNSTYGDYNDYDIRIDEKNRIYIEFFEHLRDNELAGVFMEVVFTSPIDSNICKIPML